VSDCGKLLKFVNRDLKKNAVFGEQNREQQIVSQNQTCITCQKIGEEVKERKRKRPRKCNCISLTIMLKVESKQTRDLEYI
jgi:hypothetical protein